MKTFYELKEEYARNGAEIKKIEEFFSGEAHTRYIAITGGKILPKSKRTDEQEKMLDELKKEEKEKSDRLNVLKLGQRILYENIRQAYFMETMPKVLEVFDKFKGKPIGEKTEAKIREELSKQGIYFSINYGGQYGSDYIHVSPTFGSGYSFRYDDMKIYTKYDGGNKRPMLGGTQGNRLIVYDMDMYYLNWCSDYVDDYMFRASSILYRYKELKEQREKLEQEYKSFNDLLPRSMNRLNIGDHLYSSIA